MKGFINIVLTIYFDLFCIIKYNNSIVPIIGYYITT